MKKKVLDNKGPSDQRVISIAVKEGRRKKDAQGSHICTQHPVHLDITQVCLFHSLMLVYKLFLFVK